MDINYFKEFSVLAETKNYWEAAERLFINQSTLSKHIKTMERELGVPLFFRTTRRVELTEFGRALLPYAQSIMHTQFEYSTTLLLKRSGGQGLFSIGSIPAMAQYGITQLLLNFQKVHPDCRFKVTEDDAKNLTGLLASQKCELIFLREPIRQPDGPEDELARIPYLTDQLVALLPKGHPLANRDGLTLRELRDEKFCFLKESSMIYDLCRLACQEAGFIPNIVFDSHRLDSIFDMVTYGKCVALLMDQHAKKALDAPVIPFSSVKIVPAISTRISLCYRRDRALSWPAGRFVQYFQQCLSNGEIESP